MTTHARRRTGLIFRDWHARLTFWLVLGVTYVAAMGALWAFWGPQSH